MIYFGFWETLKIKIIEIKMSFSQYTYVNAWVLFPDRRDGTVATESKEEKTESQSGGVALFLFTLEFATAHLYVYLSSLIFID